LRAYAIPPRMAIKNNSWNSLFMRLLQNIQHGMAIRFYTRNLSTG
jgi:hypothetical protein